MHAGIRKGGAFAIKPNRLLSGRMTPHFPAPNTEAERMLFREELKQLIGIVQATVADLPRVERIARQYNRPIART